MSRGLSTPNKIARHRCRMLLNLFFIQRCTTLRQEKLKRADVSQVVIPFTFRSTPGNLRFLPTNNGKPRDGPAVTPDGQPYGGDRPNDSSSHYLGLVLTAKLRHPADSIWTKHERHRDTAAHRHTTFFCRIRFVSSFFFFSPLLFLPCPCIAVLTEVSATDEAAPAQGPD